MARKPSEPVLGRLVERGLHDELKGSAYAIVEGVDGRTHHLQFSDLEMTGDAKPGAIVEARAYEDDTGCERLSLATRSDFRSRSRWRPGRDLARPPAALTRHRDGAGSARRCARPWTAASIIS